MATSSQRVLMLVLLAALASPVRASGPDPRVQDALWRGMDYMIRSAADPDHFEEYASDYLFFFADVSRLADPWLAWVAQQEGLRLGAIYLENYFSLDSADEVIDAASALYALDELGLDVTAPLVLLRSAATWYPVADYLGFDPAQGQAPDLDSLIDLIIGFHFTDRMDVPIGVSYMEVLPYVAAVDYRLDPGEDTNHHIDVNNLVTHLVYTVSGYASWNVPAALMPREEAYFRQQMAYTLCWADPESLSEYIDSLKLMGYGMSDPDLRTGVEILLAIQKPDGRWEPEDVADEYDRYHATWCAMDALRDYELEEAMLLDSGSLHILTEWAIRQQTGRSLSPWLPIGPDPLERGE